MPSEICIALRGLFPPGSLPEDDSVVDRVIASCAAEFETVLAKLILVTASGPLAGPFSDRYRRIGLSNHGQHCVVGDFKVSNNLQHLSSLLPGISVVAGENSIEVSGIKNDRVMAKIGRLRSGHRLSKIFRGEEDIWVIETTKNAHVRATYKETLYA